MKTSYFSRASGHMYCYFGDTFDLYLDETLVPMTLPEILHQDLKRQGYERILFFDYTEGMYFLDGASKSLLHGKKQTPPTISGPKLRGGTRGKLLTNAQTAPTAPSQPAPAQELKITVSASEMLRYAGEFMRDSSIRTAVIFPDGLNMLEHFKHEVNHGAMLNDLFKRIANIGDLTNRNVMIFLFDRPEGPVSEFFRGQDWEYVWTALKNQAVFHYIAPVTSAEIRLALNYLRLVGVGGERLKLDMANLPEICKLIASRIQRNLNSGKKGQGHASASELTARRLKDLMQYLMDYYIYPQKELTLENCRKICGENKKAPAMERLMNRIGNQQLKELMQSILEEHGRRQEQSEELPSRLEPPVQISKKKAPNLNIILYGNKGTGKSTIVEIICDVFAEYGLLPSGHMVETRPSDLIGQYTGHSEANMRDAINRARGGILFIDEAYSFDSGEGPSRNTFYEGMVNELVGSMTKDFGEYAVIMAGYPDRMEQMLQKMNPGLRERFAHHVTIADYSPEELAEIFRSFAKSQNLTVTQKLDDILVDFFGNWYFDCQNDWGNARNVENLVGSMQRESGGKPLTVNMIPEELKKYASDAVQRDVKEQLEEMVGLAEVKQTIADFENMLRYSRSGKRRNYHFIFAGNPGTGKTEVAKHFGQLMKGAGVLKSGSLVEVKADELLKKPDALSSMIKQSKDRVLFIDEAYQLLRTPHIIDQLVVETAPDRKDFPFTVICAGYKKEMSAFMDANVGNERRFEILTFESYSTEELMEILKRVLKKSYRDYTVTDDFLAATEAHFRYYGEIIAAKHNAGYISKYMAQVEKLLYRKLKKQYGNQKAPKEAYVLDASMVPEYLCGNADKLKS